MVDEPKKKDRWDKLGIVLQPVGGLLTAMAVAYVGVIGSRVLEDRQSRETNARLYSELMSRREEAESSLRKDMLVSIIEKYLSSHRQRPRREGAAAGDAGRQFPRFARPAPALLRPAAAAAQAEGR